MPKSPWWVWASIAAMTLASLVSLAQRYRVEASNKAVGVMMEGQTLNEMAAQSGQTLEHLLTDLKPTGLTGVALSEETFADLVDRGEASVSATVGPGARISASPQTLVRVAEAIGRRGGLGSQPVQLDSNTFVFLGDVRALRATSVGIDPEDAAAVRAAGLVLVARHANVFGASPSYISEMLAESKRLGASAYLPSGDQVLGHRESVDSTADTLEALGMHYLTAEFVKTTGDSRMTARIPGQTLRLHSMQQAEVDRSSPGAVIDRYVLAFRERNVRWLLVRPLGLGGADPVRSTSQFLVDLKQAVADAKGAVREPRPYTDPVVPSLVFLAIGLLAAPWLAWTASFWGRGRWWAVLVVVGSVLIGVAAFFESLRPYVALAIGIAGPVAAFQLWTASEHKRRSFLVDLAIVSAVSLAAGLAVAGLDNGLPYLIQAEQPIGIKAILIVPVLLVGWMLTRRLASPKDIAERTVRWGPLLAGLALIGALVFLVVRSGNDAPSAVSGSELKLRSLLDQLFYARPRTKEFLIGHPALVLGFALNRRAAENSVVKSWATVLLAIGVIGQSDIVDTMCHTHTPLDIGLARIGLGLIVGGIIGSLLWVPLRAWANRLEGT